MTTHRKCRDPTPCTVPDSSVQVEPNYCSAACSLFSVSARDRTLSEPAPHSWPGLLVSFLSPDCLSSWYNVLALEYSGL